MTKKEEAEGQAGATDLDAMMAGSMDIFDGETVIPVETPDPDATDQDPDAAAAAPDQTPADPPDADGDKSPDTLPPEATADKADDKEPPAASDKEPDPDSDEDPDEDPDPDKEPRFKDLASADKGYREVQARATRAEQENAGLKKELADFKKTEADKQALAARSETIATYKEQLKAYSKERQTATMATIDALDPEAADYNDKVADIMAEKDADIDAWRLEHTPVFQPGPPAPDADPAFDTAPDADPDSAEALMARVNELAVAGGIARDDPTFSGFCQMAPLNDDAGRALDFDAQVDWAIGKTKGHYKKIEDGIREKNAEAAAAASKANQERQLPMGKGGTGAPKADAPAEPMTMAAALSAVASENVYDGRDPRVR
ncbi:MAG: hypothetical protein HGJ94_14030 [Desulfosarcina sp.]|nr:hypothetical protein [Desulfosarcina sp.]MBC2741550.1 hypothetical protein [Desulfosarcina sp.]MBC2764464.1 hypothetical protein [Desulfosarcina sp.]